MMQRRVGLAGGDIVFQYQDNGRYFAQTANGLEELAAEELRTLGATDVQTAYRGLHFSAQPGVMYRINYRTQLVSRVLAPLARFGCHDTDYLYQRTRNIDWSQFLHPDQTFAVFANVSGSNIRHSQYAALRIKDAVVDRFRAETGRRPSIDTREPHLWINLHLANNVATLSVDTSGGSLHRRGYRRESVEAPMQETVAAAVLELAGWDGTRPLHDPMCGSGTLLCEALIKAAAIPAGYLRQRFGFMQLPDFDLVQWKQEKRAADGAMVPGAASLISGSDSDGKAVAASRLNLAALPQGLDAKMWRADFRDLPGLPDKTIVCNPPYGLRLKKGEDLAAFYADLGDFLKQRCAGAEAYIYFGKRELIKSVGLRPTWKKELANGGLDGRLVKYELY
jgi:putative N6-adenine-specific DNA methylase